MNDTRNNSWERQRAILATLSAAFLLVMWVLFFRETGRVKWILLGLSISAGIAAGTIVPMHRKKYVLNFATIGLVVSVVAWYWQPALRKYTWITGALLIALFVGIQLSGKSRQSGQADKQNVQVTQKGRHYFHLGILIEVVFFLIMLMMFLH